MVLLSKKQYLHVPRDPPLQFTWPSQQPQSAKYYATTDIWFFSARNNTCTYQETHPCNSPGLLSNLNQRNIMQQQTDGSLQQEAILAQRDPPLQFTWPTQQPQSAKYYAKADIWFSSARNNTCTKRPTLAIHLACSATSSSEILCNNRQMVLCSKKQYLH